MKRKMYERESIGHAYGIVLVHKSDWSRLYQYERLEDLRITNISVFAHPRPIEVGTIFRLDDDEIYVALESVSYIDFETEREMIVVKVRSMSEVDDGEPSTEVDV